MPRIRTIKPEFFQDEKLSPLAPIDRLVFLGLISMADDAGRLLDNVKVIDAFIFPCSDDSSGNALRTLADLGRIIRYTSPSGQALIQIRNWTEHQKVEKPNKHVLPPPPPEDVDPPALTVFPDDSPTDRGGIGEDSPATPRYDLGPTTYDLRPTTSTSSTAARVREAIPDTYRPDFDALLERVTVPTSLLAELDALHSGLHPPAYSWDEIGLAIHDLVLGGKHERPNARQLRRYVEGAHEQLAGGAARPIGSRGPRRGDEPRWTVQVPEPAA